MEFSILGPVEVTVSGRPLELSGARARAVLATLIVHANHVVAAEQLLDELWPLQPADKALASLQVRLSELRKVLRPAADSPGGDRLTTRPPGYLLRVTEAELDSCRFTELTAEAADAMAEDKPAIALHRLDEALRLSGRLWRASTRHPSGPRPAVSRNCGSPRSRRGPRRCWNAASSATRSWNSRR